MFKKIFFLVCFIFLSIAVNAQKGSPFFYELISNDSKTINFVFGFYPSSYNYVESKDVEAYTNIKAAVINNAKDHGLKWNDYKINILLKSGVLIRSYTTAAEDGDYACNYSVAGETTHYQYFCFHTKFTSSDIDKVWLVMGDDQIFNLVYDKNN